MDQLTSEFLSSSSSSSISRETMSSIVQNRTLKSEMGASLVAQCLRICLPMQGTWVQALVREDPTCRGATRPVSHNY